MKYESIRAYLKKTGITEAEFAAKVGICQSYVSHLKNGTRKPKPRIALKIERLTGIPFKKLVLGESPKNGKTMKRNPTS